MPFDFQAYIARQKPVGAPRVVVQNYAYVEDMRRLRQLSEVPLLSGALLKALKAWSFTDRIRIRRSSKPIKYDKRSSQIWHEVCAAMHPAEREALIIPYQKTSFEPSTDGNEPFFGLSPSCCVLPTSSMRFVFGRAIGAVVNGHVRYMTLSRFIDRLTHGFYGKATLFADALLHWQSSAAITQDRAGLLASRDFSAAMFMIMKSVLDWSDEEIMNEIRRYHAHENVDYGESDVEKRISSLEVFTKSSLYAQHCGQSTTGSLSMTEVDEKVLKIMIW